MRQQEATLKHEKQFKTAYANFLKNEQLLRDDLLVIIRTIKRKDDGPIKKNMVDLRAQLDSMRSRLDKYAVNVVQKEPEAIRNLEPISFNVSAGTGHDVVVNNSTSAGPINTNSFSQVFEL